MKKSIIKNIKKIIDAFKIFLNFVRQVSVHNTYGNALQETHIL